MGSEIVHWPLFLLYAVSFVPAWVWFSCAVTVIHTAEECSGEIWDYLRSKTGLPITWWMYIGFQLFVLWLGFQPDLWMAFVALRFGDVAFTHLLLRAPGGWTAPLLIADAEVILYWA